MYPDKKNKVTLKICNARCIKYASALSQDHNLCITCIIFKGGLGGIDMDGM